MVRRNWLFAREVRRGDIAGLVLRAVDRGMQPTSPRILLVDREGRCMMRVFATYYSRDDASRLADALEVPVDGGWNRVATRAALVEEVPGAISWLERDQRGLSVLATLAVIAIGTAVGLALKG